MSFEFLSEDWFSAVEQIKEKTSIEVPAALQGLVLNLTVGETQFSLVNGMISKGHDESAVAGMTLPSDLARKIFLENDASAGVSGFMTGQVKIDGDMSKIMALQSVQPTDTQKEALSEILKITRA